MPRVQRNPLIERGIQVPPTARIPNPLGEFGEIFGKVGEQLGAIDKSLKEAQDAAIFSEKKADYLEKVKALELSTRTIGNPDEMRPAFSEGLDVLEKSIIADVDPSKALRTDLQEFFNTERGVRIPRIMQAEFDLRMGQTKAAALSTLAKLERAVALAETPDEEIAARNEVENYIRTVVDHAIFTPEEIQKQGAGFERNVDFHRANRLLRLSPTKLLDALQNREFKNLTVKDVDKFMSMAVTETERREKAEDKAITDAQDQNRALRYQQLQDGELTQDILDTDLTARRLDPDDFEDLSKTVEEQVKDAGPSDPELVRDWKEKVMDREVTDSKQIRQSGMNLGDREEVLAFFNKLRDTEKKLTPGRRSPHAEGWSELKATIQKGFTEPFDRQAGRKTAKAMELYNELTESLAPDDRDGHQQISDALKAKFGTEKNVRSLRRIETPLHKSPADLKADFKDGNISRRAYQLQIELWDEIRQAKENQNKPTSTVDKKSSIFFKDR